eukprot:2556213-Alexandrium_andersonii.AAC.1
MGVGNYHSDLVGLKTNQRVHPCKTVGLQVNPARQGLRDQQIHGEAVGVYSKGKLLGGSVQVGERGEAEAEQRLKEAKLSRRRMT